MNSPNEGLYKRFDKVEVKDVLKPEPRSGHRIVVDEGNLFSIGGFNPNYWDAENDEDTYYPLFKELWQFNFATRKWINLESTGPMPVELASHSAVMLRDYLFVFGGTGVPFGDTASNKLYVCDLKTLQWKQVNCSGDYPMKGYGQSILVYNDSLYVFGGTTGWEYNADLHKLDFTTFDWELQENKKHAPDGRYRHEMACYNNKLYILGGGRSYNCYGFDKIPAYDISGREWGEVSTASDVLHGFPKARRCHSCVQQDQDVYICGGYDGLHIFGDVWWLCLKTLRWTKIDVTMPEPAYFHSATLSPVGYMLVFGGVTKIDNERTSNIYRLWLRPASSLKELCWFWLLEQCPHLVNLSENTLLELGIPQNLVSRIKPIQNVSDQQSPSVCG